MKKRLCTCITAVLVLTGCAGSAEESSAAYASAAETYDTNGDGLLQTGEFPYPVSAIYGLEGEYAGLYEIAARYQVDRYLENISTYDPEGVDETMLILPSLTGVHAKYTDRDGNINYVCTMTVYFIYDLGRHPDSLPAPVFSDSGTGGSGEFCRIIMTPEGDVVSVQDGTDGEGNTEQYYVFCGPYPEIADALTGKTDAEYEKLFTMTNDMNTLLEGYLNYYFLYE
ncbi:MAG: hypothetical protein IJ480_07395 [Clostridia bacterium]|nr:hypothetical protein [Clostridia bacterium]